MKKMKKIASVLLALVMVVAMAMPAFATETGTTQGTSSSVKGTITITNATVGQNYTVYKIFELESYNQTNSAYTYKIVEAWRPFFAEGAKGAEYATIDGQGYITWKEEKDNEAAAAEFAKEAIAWAKVAENKITPTGTQEAAKAPEEDVEEVTIQFADLDLGYYLVDSTVGTVCSLNTTDNLVNITDKNVKPTVDKNVAEDSKEGKSDEYGKDNDAHIGQLVKYQTTITAQPGAINYVLHDKMTGLDFVEVTGVTLNGETVSADNYTVIKGEGVSEEKEDEKCSFEVEFENTFLAGITETATIVVSYTAKVNADAVIAGTGNPNETYLSYGQDPSNTNKTEPSETRTYTFAFDLVKTKADAALLTGATFQLYEGVATGGTPMNFVKVEGGYRVATDEDIAEDITQDIVVEDGQVNIAGLDGGTTYYLEETVAPDGYNKLADRVKVELTERDIDAEKVATVHIVTGKNDTDTSDNTTATVTDDKYVSGGVQVINQTGSLLPSTGGIGTTIFYIVGTVLVVGAGILLVTKKRMKEQ